MSSELQQLPRALLQVEEGAARPGAEDIQTGPRPALTTRGLNELPSKAHEPAAGFLGKLQPTQTWTGSYGRLCQG